MSNGFSRYEIGDITRLVLESARVSGTHQIMKLEKAIAAIIAEPGRPRLIIDFRNVDEIASAMLAAMLRVHELASRAGGRVALVELTDRVLEMFRFTRLDRTLELHETEHRALAAFRSHADRPTAGAASDTFDDETD
ncbi:MAG: STAS domain-containing protein [Planctomycetota bacterium]